MQSKSWRDFVFQGHEPKAYIKAALRLLTGGAVGVSVGWLLQPFFSVVFGLPYWISYWPAIVGGFIVNLRTQVSLKNLRIPKHESESGPGA